MALTKKEAKAFMVGAVLLLVALLFVVRILPWIWAYMNTSVTVDNTTYSLSDVPGGGLLTGFIIFLIVLVMGIVIVLKTFDLF